MAQQLRNALGMPNFKSVSMVARDQRIKEAKNFADRSCQRDLTRDRSYLERKEAKLLADIKRHALKGDLHGARLLAKQIAIYRRISERNFEASVSIATKMQMMSSNHKVNQAEMEAVKGISYANANRTVFGVEMKEQKAAMKMEEFETMEDIMNEGMDEIYNLDWADPSQEGASSSSNKIKSATVYEIEIDSIMNQALDPKRSREYFNYHMDDTSKTKAKRALHFHLLDSPTTSCTIYIDTLDLSVDMVKRAICKDPFAIQQLNLHIPNPNAKGKASALVGAAKPFAIGKLVDGEFHALCISASLKGEGVRSGDVLYIMPNSS
ncbi:hypothetical protein BKA69DRAFT_1047158 [Paraphysoderma sedebokerense]|nr:hypothetical protein BKA69DRAFT_1047158 [Paraphysoderma sedebokerense]